MSRAGQCGSAWLDSPERGTKGPFWYTRRHSKTSVCPPRIRWRMQQGCSSRAPMDGLLPPLLLSSLGDHTPHCPSHTSLWLHHLPLQGIPVLPSSSQDFSHIRVSSLFHLDSAPHDPGQKCLDTVQTCCQRRNLRAAWTMPGFGWLSVCFRCYRK